MNDDLRDGLDDFYKQLHAPPTRATGRAGGRAGRTGKYSVALAVHPDQAVEAEAHARRIGVPTRFRRDGRPFFESRRHQAKYIREWSKFSKDHNGHGIFNKDGGYGD